MTEEQLLKDGFICTDPDTNQWLKKLSDTHFFVYDKDSMHDIELKDYTDEQLDSYLAAYYPSIDLVRDLYGEDANQIIAECIAEQS